MLSIIYYVNKHGHALRKIQKVNVAAVTNRPMLTNRQKHTDNQNKTLTANTSREHRHSVHITRVHGPCWQKALQCFFRMSHEHRPCSRMPIHTTGNMTHVYGWQKYSCILTMQKYFLKDDKHTNHRKRLTIVSFQDAFNNRPGNLIVYIHLFAFGCENCVKCERLWWFRLITAWWRVDCDRSTHFINLTVTTTYQKDTEVITL